MHEHVRVCMCASVCVCACARMCICVCACMCVRVCACMQVCVCPCMHVCVSEYVSSLSGVSSSHLALLQVIAREGISAPAGGSTCRVSELYPLPQTSRHAALAHCRKKQMI